MITLIIEYFQDGIMWKPRYNSLTAASFFRKVTELKHQHIKFNIKVLEE